jgi:hypothetical protein
MNLASTLAPCLRTGLIALTLTINAAHAQNAAQATLPRVQLQAGLHLIHAEVADEPLERQTGLMLRDKMAPNDGMLFVFNEPGLQCFWMKNTLLPLSIAFIADDGTIINLADMQPRDDKSQHCSAKPVRFALEMNQGWFAKRGIKAGSKLSGVPFKAAAAARTGER